MPESLKQQGLLQLHSKHIGIEKTLLLAHDSIYWLDTHGDKDDSTKSVWHVLNLATAAKEQNNTTWDILQIMVDSMHSHLHTQ